MRIDILANIDERCGNAQDARNIRNCLMEYVPQSMHDRGGILEVDITVGVCAPYPDVLIVAWHPAKVTVTADMVRTWQSWGIKVILLFMNSYEQKYLSSKSDILGVCDAVIAHEPLDITYNGLPAENFHCIPNGTLEVTRLEPVLHPHTFGTAGFPFHWKRPDVVIKAAKACDVYARIFAPKYPGYDYAMPSWHNSYPGRVVVHENWLPEENIIRICSEHVLNIFWFQSQDIHDQYGQSGSVHLGIAAKRPMIISRHRKFRTLLANYPDSFYVCDTEEEVYSTAKEILQNVVEGKPVKLPIDAFEGTKWSTIIPQFWQVIRQVRSGSY